MNKWFKVTDSLESVTIDVYGDIGGSCWDENAVQAKEFVEAVRAAEGRHIDLHVNSGGGSVFDAYAMMAALKSHGDVTAHVDGLAASAASFLLAAANKVVMNSEAWMMIHRASGMVFGNSKDMAEAAEWLGRIDDQIAGIYANRAFERGVAMDEAEYLGAMDKTTWYTAADALAAGLIDVVDEQVTAIAASATADRHTLASMPEALRKPVTAPIEEPTNEADNGEDGQETETPKAQERVVVMDNKVFTINQ